MARDMKFNREILNILWAHFEHYIEKWESIKVL